MYRYLFLFFYLGPAFCTFRLEERFGWATVDYEYPTQNDREFALRTKRFVPENNLPVGIELWNDKIFVTVPRWRIGIPSTLNYISRFETSKSPRLIPYPSWESNELANCETGLTTVYRLKADKCDRLWVLDTGTFGIGNTTQNPCPYALNIYHLKTDKRIRRYQLRPEDTNANTFIANIAVDLGKSCDDAFAYLSDELGYGLIVYSWRENRSWRFQHSYFLPDPLAGDFTIAGLNFQWGEEGIFGMALSPVLSDGDKILHFSPLASNREFAVSTRILRNSSRVEDSYHDFVFLPERGTKAHVTAKVISNNGIMLLNLIDRNAIGCWNIAKTHQPSNIGIVDQDDVGLIFPSDVKIDDYGFVWVMSDRMSTFLVSSLNYNEINFRIFVTTLDQLVAGSVCEGPRRIIYTTQFSSYDSFLDYSNVRK